VPPLSPSASHSVGVPKSMWMPDPVAEGGQPGQRLGYAVGLLLQKRTQQCLPGGRAVGPGAPPVDGQLFSSSGYLCYAATKNRLQLVSGP